MVAEAGLPKTSGPAGTDAGVPAPSRGKRIAGQAFRALERVGVHVLPAHFYSPVADRRWLQQNPELWRKPFELPGVEWDIDAQAAWLEEACRPYANEVRGFPFLQTLAERGIGFRYGLIEAQLLHCVLRTYAPPRIVEIGSGASTSISSDAVSRNVAEGRPASTITSIDPYAPPELTSLPHVEVLASPAQTIDASITEQLGEGDLLFIDSTHVVKTGSELHRIYLDLLPRLKPGVLVHIHDTYLPYLYSPWVFTDPWDWQETALLAALLTNNSHLEVVCSQPALHHAAPERVQAVLPDYRPRPLSDGIDPGNVDGHFPSSTWLRTR